MPGSTTSAGFLRLGALCLALGLAQPALAESPPRTSPPPEPPIEREQPPVMRGGGDVFAHSSSAALEPGDLERLPCDQLWAARNEIYARNGYCFRTERGRNHFGNAGCRTSSQNILSRLEQGNVERIKSWEARRGCR